MGNHGFDGIFCIDRKPAVYFKTVQIIDPEKIKKLHRLLWNQGIATILVIISKHKVHVYSGLAYPAKKHEDIASDTETYHTISAKLLTIHHLFLGLPKSGGQKFKHSMNSEEQPLE